MANKPNTDNSWFIFIILGGFCFWGAWWNSDKEGHLHTALSIWAGTCIAIAVVGLVINLIMNFFNKD